MIATLLDSVSAEGRLQPRKVADLLGMTLDDTAGIVGTHRNTLSRAPDGPQVQEGLGVVVRILLAAMDLMADPGTQAARDRAVLWFKHQPLEGFGGRTAAELVRSGDAEAVMSHLRAMEDGGYA